MNENSNDALQHPGRRPTAGASPSAGRKIPDFADFDDFLDFTESAAFSAPPAVTAPPRRGSRTGPGHEVPREYVAEIYAMPSTIPAPGIPKVEEAVGFERLADDDAPVDFDVLRSREADEAFRAAILPPGTPPGSGGVTDFAVYGEPEVIRPEASLPPHLKSAVKSAPAPETARTSPASRPNQAPATPAGTGGLDGFAVYGDPDSAPRAPAATPDVPVDPSRDVGVTEKPIFYDDPSGDDVTHNVRLTPGKALSLGNRRVYRADSRGIPIFSPGWTASMAAAHYRRGLFIKVSMVFVFLALSAVLAFLAIGADSNYLSVKERGIAVEGTVAAVATDVRKDEKAATTDLGATVTETASVKFQVDGKTYTRNISDSSKSAAAMIGTDMEWKTGQKVRMYADLEHSGQVLVEDTSQPGRLNYISLSPLIFAVLFGATAGLSWHNASKMRQIAKTEE